MAPAREASGQISREQAQTTAKRAFSQMRYDASEYFWINDRAPTMVMHAVKPELDGKDLSGMKDPNGLFLLKAFVEKVRTAGKGFVAYQWTRPGTESPVDKVSYVQGFAPWGWLIGPGVYVDDLHQAGGT